MTVRMIIAVDRDNAIGQLDGALPWHLPEDLKRFKALTTGGTVLMGRTTFDSLKRPGGLPNRRNVIVSRSPQLGLECTSDPVRWIRAHQLCLGCPAPDLWIIGGASVYDLALENQLVDEIYITKVEVHSGALVKPKFELFDLNKFKDEQRVLGVHWRTIDREEHDGPILYIFETLKKAL